jgi:uncharacterized cupin superfamily protein
MGKIDVAKLKKHRGSGYPSPYDLPTAGRIRQRLGDASGLTQFGVNLLYLEPGAWSSQRHWHAEEDEFVFVLSGDVVLVTDAGEEILQPGDCAGFPKGRRDGHHLINRSTSKTAVCLEVGTRAEGGYCAYPDIDMVFDSKVGQYARRDGTVYPPKRSRAVKRAAPPKAAATTTAKKPAKAPRRAGR